MFIRKNCGSFEARTGKLQLTKSLEGLNGKGILTKYLYAQIGGAALGLLECAIGRLKILSKLHQTLHIVGREVGCAFPKLKWAGGAKFIVEPVLDYG
jgi:hypothetical protein